MTTKPESMAPPRRPSGPKRERLHALLGNIIDHWELVPNDIRSDPGMDNLNAAVRAADKALGGRTK